MNPIGNIVDKEGQANIVDLIYPVGSIYLSVNSANPSTLFGGTWEAWGTGKVPVGIDTSDTDFNTVEKTGGAKTVTLTSAQSGVPAHSHGLNSHTHSIPALSGTAAENGNHRHSVPAKHDAGTSTKGYYAQGTGNYAGGGETDYDGKHTHSVTTTASTTGQATGSTANNTAANASQAHTNVQPYITCYMWKRTA